MSSLKSFILLFIVQVLAWGQALPVDAALDLVGKQASSSLTGASTLSEIQRYAIVNNPAIQSTWARWQASLSQVAVAKGLPDPTVSLGYFISSVETAVGPQEFRLSVTQMFPWFGKRKQQGLMQKFEAERIYHQLESQILGLRSEVLAAYYELFYLDQAVTTTRQSIELIKNWEEVIRTKYKTSVANHPDLIKTQIELLKLSDDLATLTERISPARQRLEALLNINELPALRYAPPPYYGVSVTQDSLWNIAAAENPGLKAGRAEVSKARQTLSRSRLDYFPNVGLGVDKVFTGEKPGMADSGKDPLMLMVSMNIPIWFGRTRAGVKSAQFNARAAELQLADSENRIQESLANQLYALETAQRKVILYRESLVPKSIESLKATEKAYITGNMDFLSLIDAQRRLLDFNLILDRALVDVVIMRSKLENVIGRTL